MPQERAALAERGSGAVVVGVSGSDSDLLTVPEAAAAADRERARLLVVHVIGSLTRDGHGDVDAALLERFAEAGEAVVARALALARDAAPGLAVDDALLSGDRVGVLHAVTTHAQRLYVGTSETSSVRPMVPGLITGGVTDTVRCPVLLVRGPRSERGGRVLAYVDRADERAVVAFAEREARARGISLTVVNRGPIGEPHEVAPDVPLTRLLVPQQPRVQRLLGSQRNDLLVVSAEDLRSARSAEGARSLRRRYAGTAPLVAVVAEPAEGS
jgi:nucleotide-binding universal stress UspA family protein